MNLRLLRFLLSDYLNRRALLTAAAVLLIAAWLTASLPALRAARVPSSAVSVALSVVDEDRSPLSRAIVEQLRTLPVVHEITVQSLEQAKTRLEANEILMILVIPPDFFERSLHSMQRQPIDIYLNPRMPAESAILLRTVDTIAAGMATAQAHFIAFMDQAQTLWPDPGEYQSTLDRSLLQIAVQVLQRDSFVGIAVDNQFQIGAHILAALLCLLASLIALLPFMQVLSERRLGLQARLRSVDLPWWRLLMTRQAAGLLFLLLLVLPLILALSFTYEWQTLGAALLYVVGAYWVLSALSIAAAYLGDGQEWQLMAAWLGMLALLLLGGCIYPYPLLPASMRAIGVGTPLRWSMQGLTQILRQPPESSESAVALWSSAWRQDQPGWLQGLVFLLFTAVATGIAGMTGRRARPSV